MFLRSKGWLWIATVFQALVQALHGQTVASSPTPAPSSSTMQPVSEPEQWKVEGPTLEQQQPGVIQTGTPFEQEPGWSGELSKPAYENNEFQLPPNELPVEPRALGLMYSLGPLDIRPIMQFTTVYSDNILAASSNQKSDVIYIIAPGASLSVGDYLQKEYSYITLEYVPTLNLYNHYSTLNSLDQHLRIDAQYGLERLKLSAYFGYDKAFGGNRDLGGLVNSDYYTMGVAAKYLVNERFTLEALGDQVFAHYGVGTSGNGFVNHDWLNYVISPKLTVSAGGAFGVVQPNGAGTQYYEQGLLRLQYVSTDKLSFNGNAGFEVRQFPNGAGTRLTPVFELATTYRIFPGTTLSLSGARSVTYSSLITGSNYTATTVIGGITQHLIGKLSIGVDVGFENDSYFQVSGAPPGGIQRQDNYVTVSPYLTYRLNEWANISVSYFYRDNNSNFPGKAFYNNQIALQVHVGF